MICRFWSGEGRSRIEVSELWSGKWRFLYEWVSLG